MIDDYRRTDSASELVEIIHEVRRRWRMKLALRGAMAVAGLSVLVLLLSAYGLESWRFSAGAIVTFRVIVGLALVGLVAYLLVRPLMRQASDEQVRRKGSSQTPENATLCLTSKLARERSRLRLLAS